jgi:hypothetical protein
MSIAKAIAVLESIDRYVPAMSVLLAVCFAVYGDYQNATLCAGCSVLSVLINKFKVSDRLKTFILARMLRKKASGPRHPK